MHVVISRFAVANGLTDEVKEAFRRRPHLVDEAAGWPARRGRRPP